MFSFLQCERTHTGRWLFSFWSNLTQRALKNVKARISIRTYDDRVYSGQLRILSLLEMNKRQGIDGGQCLVLFDVQLLDKNNSQPKVFDFKVDIIADAHFCEHLNKGSVSPYSDLMADVANNPTGSRSVVNINVKEGPAARPEQSLVEDNMSGNVEMGHVNHGIVAPEDLNAIFEAVNEFFDSGGGVTATAIALENDVIVPARTASAEMYGSDGPEEEED